MRGRPIGQKRLDCYHAAGNKVLAVNMLEKELALVDGVATDAAVAFKNFIKQNTKSLVNQLASVQDANQNIGPQTSAERAARIDTSFRAFQESAITGVQTDQQERGVRPGNIQNVDIPAAERRGILGEFMRLHRNVLFDTFPERGTV